MEKKTISERFWDKVNKLNDNDCWEWTAGTYSNGYGQFFDGEHKIGAHRFSYELHHGKINDKKILVCHKCDNRKCVNPNHLFLGTQKINMRDMLLKGRKVNASKKGTLNGRTIVTEKEVLEIRAKYIYKKYGAKRIGLEYGLSETQVLNIVNNALVS